MLTLIDCQKHADELERAASRMHLRSHRDAYLAVAAEWRRLGTAVNSGAPIAPDALAAIIAAQDEQAARALDSPLKRSILNLKQGWQSLPAA